MEPLLLGPVYKDYLWGGSRLKTEYHKDTDCEPLAESWECSVHPDGPSIVRNGQFAGKELRDVLVEHPEYIGTKHGGNFPILVKFIDAARDLSVQVHPDDNYAKEHEGDNGKTEMWYLVGAEPNATIIKGFNNNLTPEMLAQSIEEGNLSKYLNKIEVKRGNSFLVKPGTVHAICAGCTIIEVQQSSNVTYRLYDYDRVDKNGNKRELHVEKALDVVNLEEEKNCLNRIRCFKYRVGSVEEQVIRHRLFNVDRVAIHDRYERYIDETSFEVLVVTDGKLSVGSSIEAEKGDTVLLPAGLGKQVIKGKAELLYIKC